MGLLNVNANRKGNLYAYFSYKKHGVLWSAFYLSPPFPIKNGDLVRDDVQNLKWGVVSDTLRSRATQTPVVLLHAKEYGMKTKCNI